MPDGVRGYLVLAGTAYLIGSIPFALIVTAIFKRADLRGLGSGNLSVYNTLFNVGKIPALIVVIGNCAAAYSALALTRTLFPSDPFAVLITLIAITVGSMWQLFAGFKGSRGSTTAGWSLLFANPLLWLAMLALWVAIVLVRRRTTTATHILHFSAPAMFWLVGQSWPYAAAGAALGAFLQLKVKFSKDDTVSLGLFRRIGVNVHR
ncbi:MAG: glycerol-3-phosphate acyltransferase [Actinobacteria bacterium]|nr:glycerol-3-phosphate acyltransferase [Actinomycetota bacterium]